MNTHHSEWNEQVGGASPVAAPSSGGHLVTRRSALAGALVAGQVGLFAATDAFAEEAPQDVRQTAETQQSATSEQATQPALALLTQPFLQIPGADSVNVVWFTEVDTEANVVRLFENGQDAPYSRQVEAETTEPARIRDNNGKPHKVYRHEAVVTGLPAFTGRDAERIPYQVLSGSWKDKETSELSDDAAVSGINRLQAQAQPGAPLKVLLTSDIQRKKMVPANMQKLHELFPQIDVVLANGDIVDRGDGFEDWFSDVKDNQCSYFGVYQGTEQHVVNGNTYSGAPLLQNAPSYTAIGNHETMGVYTGAIAEDGKTDVLSSEFNNPKPRAYAEALYQERAAKVNPSGDPVVKEQFILDNSWNVQSYSDILSLPKSNEGDERYYAVTIGDIRLVVLNVARIWRSNGMGDTSATRYVDPAGATGPTDAARGFGDHIFDPIKKGSDQYNFLLGELKSAEFQNAKYKMVMFHWQFHSLGGNAIPCYTDPVENKVTLADGREQIVYTYPMDQDYLLNDVEPLFEQYGVDLIFNAHSHLWNRFKTASGINILETSNNGNSYNAFLDTLSRKDGGYPAAITAGFTGDAALAAPYRGHEADYVVQGDPYGLSPQMPTHGEAALASSGEPYLMSNDVTEFSVLDTEKGTIDSYCFDTKGDPTAKPVLFDSFPIWRTPDRAYGYDGNGVLEKVASYATGYSSQDGGVAEIVAVSSASARAYLVNGHEQTLDVVDLSGLKEGVSASAAVELKMLKRLDVSKMIEGFAFGDITSVAVNEARKLVAVAVQAKDYADRGRVLLLTLDGEYSADYEAGVQPDMVCFTPDGSRVLTADEGEPREGFGAGTVDPKGSVTIVDLDTKQATTVYFDAWDAQRDALTARGVLLKKGLNPSTDFEPEYIAVSPDSTRAFVTLQEANAVATLDLGQGAFTSVDPLGFKNHLIATNEIDAWKDKKVDIRWGNLRGVYMPDGIACLEKDGKTYVLTANEGDASEWGEGDAAYTNIKEDVVAVDALWQDVKAEVLDPDKMDGLPAPALDGNGNPAPGTPKYMLGGRSFSVYEKTDDGLVQVFDSGSDFERITAKRYPDHFNASNKNNKRDSRSDAKGPEPESVVVGSVGDKVYAYVGLERIGGVMAYDVTDPANPAFVDYINTRDFSVDFPKKGCDPAQGDVSPEGLAFVPASSSPTGYPLVFAAHEVSGTLAVYQHKDGFVKPNAGGGNNPGGNGGNGNNGNGQGGSNTGNPNASGGKKPATKRNLPQTGDDSLAAVVGAAALGAGVIGAGIYGAARPNDQSDEG